MGTTNKRQLGQKGEQLAQQYLQRQGLEPIARNYRAGHWEVDIIAKDPKEEVLVFAEVKSYFADPLNPPEWRVSKSQQKRIIKAAYAFLDEHPEYENFSVRYDILIVDFSNYPAKIIHYEAAFWQDDFLPS